MVYSKGGQAERETQREKTEKGTKSGVPNKYAINLTCQSIITSASRTLFNDALDKLLNTRKLTQHTHTHTKVYVRVCVLVNII